MSKAVLILDMPEHCDQCKLWEPHDDWGDDKGRCIITDGALSRTVMLPLWCPLHGLPQRKDESDMMAIMHDADASGRSTLQQIGYNRGWNACLDELEGEYDERGNSDSVE